MWNINITNPFGRRSIHSSAALDCEEEEEEEEGEISGTNMTMRNNNNVNININTDTDSGPVMSSANTSSTNVPSLTSVPQPSQPSINRTTTSLPPSSALAPHRDRDRDRDWNSNNTIDRPYMKRERSRGTVPVSSMTTTTSSGPPSLPPPPHSTTSTEGGGGAAGTTSNSTLPPPPLPPPPPPTARHRGSFSVGGMNIDRPSSSPPSQQRRASNDNRSATSFGSSVGTPVTLLGRDRDRDRDVREWEARRGVSSSTTGPVGSQLQRWTVSDMAGSVLPTPLASPAARSTSYGGVAGPDGGLGGGVEDRDMRDRSVDRDRDGPNVRPGDREWGSNSGGGGGGTGREREWGGSGAGAGAGAGRMHHRPCSTYGSLTTTHGLERESMTRDREWDR